jgi:predicted CopG family antitoxin
MRGVGWAGIPRSLFGVGPLMYRRGTYPPLGKSVECKKKNRGGYLEVVLNRELLLNTHTYTELIMSIKTISITEEAYDRLKDLKKDEKASFSDVIIKHLPKKKKLSEVLKEIGANPELADSIEQVSKEMRRSSLRRVEF